MVTSDTVTEWQCRYRHPSSRGSSGSGRGLLARPRPISADGLPVPALPSRRGSSSTQHHPDAAKLVDPYTPTGIARYSFYICPVLLHQSALLKVSMGSTKGPPPCRILPLQPQLSMVLTIPGSSPPSSFSHVSSLLSFCPSGRYAWSSRSLLATG